MVTIDQDNSVPSMSFFDVLMAFPFVMTERAIRLRLGWFADRVRRS
jgi:hypothetical protein